MKAFLFFGVTLLVLFSGCSQNDSDEYNSTITGEVVSVDKLSNDKVYDVNEALPEGAICWALGASCVNSCEGLKITGADCSEPLVCCK